jgi:putative phosphoribosyl transferase
LCIAGARGCSGVVAIPVAPPSTCEAVQGEEDEVICLETHEPFYSVGTWYEDFRQVEDLEVQRALASAPS